MSIIYKTQKLFTGYEWLYNQEITVNNGTIISINSSLNCENKTIIPSLVDLQIYGAYGQLFSVFQNVESLQNLYNYCKKGGALHFMPTVATNTYEVLYNCIDAIRNYWQHGGKGCLGLHIEGPWINPIKKGAHVENLIHQPTIKQAKDLLEYGKGVIKIITLAPECCNDGLLQLIKLYDIVLSAGHSNATREQATNFFNKGINTCTHLYNAMSNFGHRDLGLVGAIFNNQTVTSSIIADGNHVNFEAIKIAKKLMGKRLYAITDAVTTTSQDYYTHELVGDKYESKGILSGSALTMYKAMQNLINYCDIDQAEAIKMCSIYPAKVINQSHQLGIIKVGTKASFLILNESEEIEEVIEG